MTHIDTHRPATRRESLPTSLALLIEVIRKNPRASEADHLTAFKRLIQTDGYEDYLNAALNRVFGIEYRTAYGAAVPPTRDESAKKASARHRLQQEAVDRASRAAALIATRILDFVMPNGVAMRDCTGTYLTKLGGAYVKIGARCGKRVVGKVLTEADVVKLMPKR